MTEPVSAYRCASDACFDASLERLDDAVDNLAESERQLKRDLASAIVDSVEMGAICLVAGLPSVACIKATGQHIENLLHLDQQAEEYAQEAAEYEAALADHLACVSR